VKLIFDEIGPWSEVKLEIIKKYASAYSLILDRNNFYHVYIDAFAGAGKHISRTTKEYVPGSPQIALNIVPPFQEYYFIDIDSAKVEELRRIAVNNPKVHVFAGDCNERLLTDVFPNVQYKEHKRGLCLLDPYGLHLNWEVIQTAGIMQSIDMFLNFPIADMNRNVLRKNPDNVKPTDIQRMTLFWGNDSWRLPAYSKIDMFGDGHKSDNETIVSAFQQRLKGVAGFKFVPDPMPMRNSNNAVVYYLFFASQKKVADHIIAEIFEKYRDVRG
jgi:three-Cys-motif partner protein